MVCFYNQKENAKMSDKDLHKGKSSSNQVRQD